MWVWFLNLEFCRDKGTTIQTTDSVNELELYGKQSYHFYWAIFE